MSMETGLADSSQQYPLRIKLENEMTETPTLFVCHGDDGGPRLHPCRRVQEALRAEGIKIQEGDRQSRKPVPLPA